MKKIPELYSDPKHKDLIREARALSGKRVDDLRRQMLTMPQAQGLETEHYFSKGMYCRRLFIPAGTLIVGKVHKDEHLFIIASGEIAITDGSQVKRYKAGDIVVSPPGTRRAGLALSDCVCVNIHRTDLTDVEAIECELIEVDADAKFDALNQIKQELLCGSDPVSVQRVLDNPDSPA